MQIALCVVVQNEVADLAEWVVHHLGIGFTTIFAYDNESNDGTTFLLKRLSLLLPVVHIPWPTRTAERIQCAAYDHCLSICAGTYDWMAAIDADEFLISTTDESITQLLHRLEQNVCIAINWLIFGSSDLQDTVGKLVLESFVQRAPANFGPNGHVKSVVRPHCMGRSINAHVFATTFPVVDVTGQAIMEWTIPGLMQSRRIVLGEWRVHHYFTRSRAHWQRRRLRNGNRMINPHRSDADFVSYDRNEVTDTAALRYVPGIKAGMRALGMQVG